MLNHKPDIVEYHHGAKSSFYDVYFDVHSENNFQSHLPKGKGTSDKVHNDIEDRPSCCRLSLVVPIELRKVLEGRNGELKISQNANDSKIFVYFECL